MTATAAPTKRLYDVKAAATYLGRSVPALREMLHRGMLPYHQTEKNGKIYLDINDMDEFIEKHKTLEKAGW